MKQILENAKKVKQLRNNRTATITSINGVDVTPGYVNVTNKHITLEDVNGVTVFDAPYTIEWSQRG